MNKKKKKHQTATQAVDTASQRLEKKKQCQALFQYFCLFVSACYIPGEYINIFNMLYEL